MTTKDGNNVVPFSRKPVYPALSDSERDERDTEKMVSALREAREELEREGKPVYPVLSEAEQDERDIERMCATLEWLRLHPNEKPKP
jgi:hypothetical protein